MRAIRKAARLTILLVAILGASAPVNAQKVALILSQAWHKIGHLSCV